MRRIGSRIQLALKHRRREAKRLELLRFRQRWAASFGEYECVGGPLDGRIRECKPRGVVQLYTGHYSIDSSDCRLHYHVRHQVPSSSCDE